MAHDFRLAFRSLTKNPGYAATAILTLALGIGANTAIFSVVHAVLLKPLPYPGADALVALHEHLPPTSEAPNRSRFPIAPPTFRDWSAHATLADLAAYAESDFIVTGRGEPERVPGANVSWNFFQTIGLPPAAGRFFLPEEDRPDHGRAAVIGYALWQSRFGGDPGLIGRTIEISSRRYEVVGVAAERFAYPGKSQIWIPLALPDSEFADDQRASFYLQGLARLKPGVSPAQAEADLSALTRRGAEKMPAAYKERGATVIPLHESIVGNVREPMVLLFATVVVVLLIACANVANLQLARASARQGEVAIRIALGASRRQIVRQLLVESTTVAAAGATAGLLIALWARDAVVALTPAAVPRIDGVAINGAVLAFTALLALATGVVFGLAPALTAARDAPRTSLSTLRRTGGGAGRQRLRSALIVSELALSLALLAAAGLLARTFWNLVHVHPGFEPSGVMTMEIVLPRAKYADPARRASFFDAVLERLSSHPTIEAAGGTTALPLAGSNMSFGFYTQSMVPDRDTPFVANFRAVTAGYFRSVGIPLVRGRAFDGSDRAGSPPVVVINEAMAATYWRTADPIGQRIAITRGRTTVWREIVGIVGNVKHARLDARTEPEMYMPYAHDPFPFLRIAVRSSERPDALGGVLKAAVWAVDRDQPVSRVRPMAEVVAQSMSETRFHTALIGSFAVLALVLASVGLYGVIAYSVSQRTHEFGVRMALGANRTQVVTLVLRQGLRLAIPGLAAGLWLGLIAARFLPVPLYGTTAGDPLTFAGVAALLAAITLLASYVPARRAVRVDPLAALRTD